MLNNAKRHDSLVNSSWVSRGWQASLSYGKLGRLFEVLYSTVRPTVHTNPSRRQSFSKMFFRPKEFENVGVEF